MDKKLLKNLKNFSSDDYVNIESFLSFTKDTQELRDSLASLESLGYIKVVYSSGQIYEIVLLPLCIEYFKTIEFIFRPLFLKWPVH